MSVIEVEQQMPVGHRRNAAGHLVPESQIKDIDKLRDEVVMDIVKAAKEQQENLKVFKMMSMGQIADFTDLSSEEYGVSYGGTKGNITLTSFDGQWRIQRAVGEHRTFDERIQAAKALIDECIEKWSSGADEKIKALVDHAFRVNKQGHIDVNQVLGLRQLNIDDPQWLEAMNAIADSIQVTGSSCYLRIYERQPGGNYKQLPMDISKL